MDRQIRKLGIALLALFLIAFAQVNYIQVFAADRIAEDPANAQRQLIAEYKVDRGSILAADGTTVLDPQGRVGERRASRRSRASISIGLVISSSKPASRARARSSGPP